MRNWLVAIREASGYSQKDVSEKVGISQPSYCNIERGERRPAVETAKAIADILGFCWTQFYEEERLKDE